MTFLLNKSNSAFFLFLFLRFITFFSFFFDSKLRASLGLKPLKVDKETPAEATAEDNYATHKQDMKKKAQTQELVDRLER
jgi:hypothetical protein